MQLNRPKVQPDTRRRQGRRADAGPLQGMEGATRSRIFRFVASLLGGYATRLAMVGIRIGRDGRVDEATRAIATYAGELDSVADDFDALARRAAP